MLSSYNFVPSFLCMSLVAPHIHAGNPHRLHRHPVRPNPVQLRTLATFGRSAVEHAAPSVGSANCVVTSSVARGQTWENTGKVALPTAVALESKLACHSPLKGFTPLLLSQTLLSDLCMIGPLCFPPQCQRPLCHSPLKGFTLLRPLPAVTPNVTTVNTA